MQRARTPDGRFQSAAPYQHARGADGRFTAQRALQVADHPTYVASHTENSESPVTALNISWLKPMAGMAGMAGMLAALGNLPTSLASDVSGVITATGTINAPPHSIFAAAANSFPTGEVVLDAADISNGTTSADGTRNASSLSMLPAAATGPLTCPRVPGLPIERCGADVPEMLVSQFVNLGMRCLRNPQSGDICNLCFCAMFHVNRALQKLVLALDKILQRSKYAIGAQMLRARPLIEYVTDLNTLSAIENLPSINELGGWREAMARIMEILKYHAGNFDLLGLAEQLLHEHPYLLKELSFIGGSLFAVVWFLKWWLWSKGDDGNVDVNPEARVEEVQEAEEEDELPPDDTPGIFVGNTTITLVHHRTVGCKRLLQYRFQVENQPHSTDNWASIPFLTDMFGSAEALGEAIQKYESMPPPCDIKSWRRVKTMTREHLRMFLAGKGWNR